MPDVLIKPPDFKNHGGFNDEQLIVHPIKLLQFWPVSFIGSD
jgi:hypothetical protein